MAERKHPAENALRVPVLLHLFLAMRQPSYAMALQNMKGSSEGCGGEGSRSTASSSKLLSRSPEGLGSTSLNRRIVQSL